MWNMRIDKLVTNGEDLILRKHGEFVASYIVGATHKEDIISMKMMRIRDRSLARRYPVTPETMAG
jgi:hypothetical protein